MSTTLRAIAMLMVAVALPLSAQIQPASHLASADFALTYNIERSKIASVDCGCFWLQGGSLEGALPLFPGVEAAVLFTGEHSSNIAPGVDLSKFAYMVGPRYTFKSDRWSTRFLGPKHEASVFAEALFGGVHGFGGAFPNGSGIASTSNSYSVQFGGGLNIALTRGFGVRALEVDYVRTGFRNFSSDSQNDLRLAFGVTYHLGGH